MAMKFPQYVSTNERTVSVVGMIDKEDTTSSVFQDGKGYIDEDEQIWIFCGEGKPKNANEYPYFWLNEDGSKEFSEPAEITLNAYNTSNMKDMSLATIIETTQENEELFNEEEINDMNAAAAFFVPIINESDDFLKKIVKSTIIKKGIDINRLKAKTEEKYILPNMKAALVSTTRMSVTYFLCWMELLGCQFNIIVADNGMDTVDNLKHELIYDSDIDSVYQEIKGEKIPVVSSNKVTNKENDEDE